MSEYEFELVYKLRDNEDPEPYLDALYEAGCDDSTPSIGQIGYIALDFIREDETAISAIISAIKNVKEAIPHAQLESFGPDLLNLTELAFEFSFTKQNMQKYSSGKSKETTPFPTPFISGKISYWRISEVAQWLNDHSPLDIDDSVIECLETIRIANFTLEKQRNLSYPSIEERLQEVA